MLYSAAQHVIFSIITNFCGCIHLRHPYGTGGLPFSLSMLWVQALPFIGIQYFTGDDEEEIKIFLVCSLCLWLILNVAFFCTIDLDFIGTFFRTITAAEYTIELFQNATNDFSKFDAVFTTRISLTEPIHNEIREWVHLNIDRWRLEAPKWFVLELIPDEFLPAEVLAAEGGVTRKKRNSVSFVEMVGFGAASELGAAAVVGAAVGAVHELVS